MRSGRSLLGTGVAALLVAGVLPALTATADAVVPQDKIVLLGGTSASKFPDVYVANADGSSRTLVHKGSTAQAPDVVALAPVNNRIAVIFRKVAKDEGPASLAVMNADGSNYKVLLKGTSSADFNSVAWNRTGTKLLVSVVNNDGELAYLAIVNTAVPHPALVRLKGSTGLGDGSFSTLSDSTVIAADDAGNLVTLTGGVTTTVLAASGTSQFSGPTFAPGDASVAFIEFSLTGNTFSGKVETSSPTGSNIKTLVATGFNLFPAWSSDGASVFYTGFNESTGAISAWKVAASGSTAPSKIVFPAGKIYEVFGAAAPDSTAPGAVTALKVTLNGAAPVVSWTPPADVDYSHAIVRRAEGMTAPSGPTEGTAVPGGRTSTVDTVSPGHTYSYGVWAVDGAGNISSVGAAMTFVALRAPVLKSLPLVSSVSTDTTFHVSWAPKFGNPGGTQYTVQWLKGDGTWATWKDSVTTTSATFGAGGVPLKPVAGKTYKLRAFVTDSIGNTSAKTSVAYVEPRDDRVASVKGSWSKSSSSAYWLKTARTTTHAKASIGISLTGSTLWVIGDRLTNGSKAEIYLDGKLVATIDTHGSLAHRHVLWSKKVKSGKHSLRVVNLATKHRTHLSVDGFASA